MSEYKIFSSSAGSGKTFTLTREYLRLLLGQDEKSYFKHILAITFTNDAALEMKTRVLATLRHLAMPHDPEASKSAIQKQQLLDILKIDEILLQKRAYAVFHQIIQDYADFNIRTIDSFTNQLSQTFALDLNIPYNYEIIFDNDKYIEQAIFEVFQKIGTLEGKFLTEVVQDFAMEKLDEGKSWQNLIPDLVKFVGDSIGDKNYRLVKKNEGLENEDIFKIKKETSSYLKATENRIRKIGKEANSLITSVGLNTKSFTSGTSGVANVFNKAENDPPVIFEERTFGARTYAAINDDKWYTQKSPDAKTIDGIKDQLRAFIEELIEIGTHKADKYLTLKAVYSSLHYLTLQSTVIKAYHKILHENNFANLSDINQRITEVVSKEPVPYIFERLGERYNHILIDEFQDTSELQYFNLLPLVGNALAKGHFNMLVGDPKQSIYRFRGGKADLMIHLFGSESQKIVQEYELNELQQEQLLTSNQYLNPANLKDNYRSKKEIVAFNNTLFEFLRNDYSQQIIKEAFKDVKQGFDEKNTGAHVEMRLVEEKSKADASPEYLAEVLSIVKEKLELGFQMNDIAVLVRKGENARNVAEFLKSEGLAVTSSDSLLLQNNIAVALMEAVLNALVEPGNVAAQQVAILIYCRYKGHTIPTEVDDSILDFFKSENVAFDSSSIKTFGLFQLHEAIANRLGLFKDSEHLPFIFTLLDEVQSFVKGGGNNFLEWQKHWEAASQKLSLTSVSSNAIHVGTIHKAKGLEYPVVIVPFIDWQTRLKNTHWFTADHIDYPELQTLSGKSLGAVPLNASKKLSQTLFEEAYEKEAERAELEELNILYVALTRPVDALYLIYRNVEIGAKLQKFKTENEGLFITKENRFIYNEGDEFHPKARPKEHSLEIAEISSTENIGNIAIQSNMAKLYEGDSQIVKGNLVHELFSYINTKDDLEDALRRMVFESIISESQKADLRSYALEVLNDPKVAELFEGDIKVENERDILLKGHKAARPDRVVFKGEKVLIVDFKTGAPLSSHRNQVVKYGQLYQQMGFENIELILLYLEPTQYVKVPFGDVKGSNAQLSLNL